MAKILIVDDEPQFRRALRVALRMNGYEVQEAANGVDALRAMHNEALDLILLDWLMPDMDGLFLCRAIRTTSAVPIIVVTSKKDGRCAAIDAGADDYLTKPFPVDELLLHIKSAIAK